MRLELFGIVVLLVGTGVVGLADEPPPAKRRVDIPKMMMQSPLKRLVQAAQATDGTVLPVPSKNPKVEAGKVNWHASFDAAKTAAQQSGKPILLFQLLGRLDNRFT
jgi:hypothetical protein